MIFLNVYIGTEPIYDVYCIGRRQHQRYLNVFFFFDVSVAQLVASMSGVVLVGVVDVEGSNIYSICWLS